MTNPVITAIPVVVEELSRESGVVWEFPGTHGHFARNLAYYGIRVRSVNLSKDAHAAVQSIHAHREPALVYGNVIPEFRHYSGMRQICQDVSEGDCLILNSFDPVFSANYLEVTAAPWKRIVAIIHSENRVVVDALRLIFPAGILRSINREAGDEKLLLFVSDHCEQSGSRDDGFLAVKVNCVVDECGFSYHPDGWHPYTTFYNLLASDGNSRRAEAFLWEYYKNFRPVTLHQLLFHDVLQSEAPLGCGWPILPWIQHGERSFISPHQRPNENGGYQLHGPNTHLFVRRETRRLLEVWRSLHQSGYCPEMFSDGYIKGYELEGSDGTVRFVVVGGQHRLAALSVLGYRVLRCRYHPFPVFPQRVKLDMLTDWPQVKSGLYTAHVAETLFWRLCDPKASRRIAIRYGGKYV